MGSHEPQRSAGWYAGVCAFWLLATWLATVGLSSIIPQIFGPVFLDAPKGTTCREDLRDLGDELMNRVAEELKPHPQASSRDTLDAFLTDFDRRLMHTKSSCTDGERAAYTELFRLRHGLSALAERFDREQLPHFRKFQALLGEHPASAPTP